MEVGAGTFHPATFLGAVGPEPTRAAYVQPSRRPTDGRYGDNPNRLQHYFQYQVVLKPSPMDFQDLYLESLVQLGIDPLKDDIRFVEDDWESPTLGAWGLGWEVWLNGMEITQVTYFQQAGGLECQPVTGEITYGLERIAMYVQGVENVFHLSWNDDIKYHDLYHQNEFEQSTYNFEVANTENLLAQFEACEAACARCLEKELPLPAYEQVLRASHVFNLLDSRRTIGVTERVTYIARVRALARNVAQCYLESRRAKGFPLLRSQPTSEHENTIDAEPDPLAIRHQDATDTLLLEVGTEELPPRAVSSFGEKLEFELKTELLAAGLIDSLEQSSQSFATPRRIAVEIEDVRARAQDAINVRRGPSLQRAFDDQGRPTNAASGFAKACGVDVGGLDQIETDSGIFLAHQSVKSGQSANDLIPSCVETALTRLPISKKMRWGDIDYEFVRPVHWVVLLHGKDVIPCRILSVNTGRKTQGHRFYSSEPILLDHATEYSEKLSSSGYVIATHQQRKATIVEQIRKLEGQIEASVMEDQQLLDEVTNLVEWPHAFCGNFSLDFLKLPAQVLICSMQYHQKYFPVVDEHGKLLAKFVGVANIEPSDSSAVNRIALGNERVLRARLSDASFFWEKDCASNLEDNVAALENLLFHRKLGSVFEKSQRLSDLVAYIAQLLGANEELLRSAAKLAKADLVSEMVGEFPDLQGTMGRYYAAEQGYPDPLCVAIGEHYLPVSASSSLPETQPGLILAMADRIDSLVGLMAIASETATGDKDPYSLRRMSVGVLRMIIERSIDIDLLATLHQANVLYGNSQAAENEVEAVFEFMLERLRNYYIEQGYSSDEFNAVIELRPVKPLDFDSRIRAVREFREVEEYSDLIAANKRIRNILNNTIQSDEFQIDPNLLCDSSEKSLYQQAVNLSDEMQPLIETSSHSEILRKLAVLRDPIDVFFDNVMVMDENPDLQRNRIALVGFVCSLFQQVAELSKLQPSKAR